MPINNPEATHFVDTYARPFAEKVRDLQVFANEMVTMYNGGINTHFVGSENESVEDNNKNTHPVVGQDVITAISRANSLLSLLTPAAMTALMELVVRTVRE